MPTTRTRGAPRGNARYIALCWPVLLLAQSPAPGGQTAPIPPVQTSITVTGRIAADAPAASSVLNQTSLAEVPGINADDRLRILPGFSLFRRSSSLVANPATQGVSLRGLGSTGAGRTLVLWDGIPLNDGEIIVPETRRRLPAPSSVPGSAAARAAGPPSSAHPARSKNAGRC